MNTIFDTISSSLENRKNERIALNMIHKANYPLVNEKGAITEKIAKTLIHKGYHMINPCIFFNKEKRIEITLSNSGYMNIFYYKTGRRFNSYFKRFKSIGSSL